MSIGTRWMLVAAAMAASLLASGSASAALTAEIRDEAGFFSPEAIQRANAEIKEIKREFKRDLLIETYRGIPADKQEEFKKIDRNDRKARNQFFENWALSRAKAVDVNGIYIQICKDPGHIQVDVGNQTQKKDFTLKNRDQLRELLVRRFQEASKLKDEAEKKKVYDKALLEAVSFVHRTMSENLGKASAAPGRLPVATAPAANPPAAAPANQKSEGSSNMGVLGWVCVALFALLVIWVVVALVRAFTGAGRGYSGGPAGAGPGGPGYGYGGGGGGGGGFMTSLLGGLFGAAAGSWLYDSFIRGHSSHGGWGSSPAYGAPPSPGAAPEDTDYSGTGGDIDSGDTGGGGGDFGDAGGGGDFGGGGGDFGGGGGDFGGGGGDFGGGGGDFGGGGGGDF